MTDELLPCTCGARAHIMSNGNICCGAGNYYCEREDYTPEEWNNATLAVFAERAINLRASARDNMKTAKRLEKRIAAYVKN